MSMFGWLTEQQALWYIQEANRKKQAATGGPLIRLQEPEPIAPRLLHGAISREKSQVESMA
jgi:hypothetical protein